MSRELLEIAGARVASYSDLSAEQARALYADYVRRGMECDVLKGKLQLALDFIEDAFPESEQAQRFLERLRK